MQSTIYRAGRLIPLAILLVLAGCQGGPGSAGSLAALDPDDPMLGGAGPYPGRPAPPPAATPIASAELPPAPAGGSGSLASLAVTTTPVAEAPSGGTIMPPRDAIASPRSDDRSMTAVGFQNTSVGAPLSGATFEQLQGMLQARGVVWQQLKTTSEKDEWHFLCAIPDPQQPGLRVNYDGRAIGPFGLAAIRAVIEKIDQDRR